MRVLGPIVQSHVAAVVGMWDDSPDGWHVTRELVGDDHPRLDPILRFKPRNGETGVALADTRPILLCLPIQLVNATH
jgi:hypothetical protein